MDRLEFASAWIYSPRGTSEVAKKSRRIRDLVKRADPVLLPRLAARVAEFVAAGNWPELFGPEVAFVPVPGRAPHVLGGLWGPNKIAHALQQVGLASSVWTALRRSRAIPKSAFAAPGERPELEEHFTSLEMVDLLVPTERVVLVDDFVTKGRTLLAAARRINAALPELPVSAFALVRTKGLVADIEHLWEPVCGEIRLVNGDAQREP